jgi:hypothetical protein
MAYMSTFLLIHGQEIAVVGAVLLGAIFVLHVISGR